MQTPQGQNGFGLIQVLMLVAFISVVIAGAIAWNEVLNKNRVDSADRANLQNLKRTISTAIKTDSSWRATVNQNVSMGCLRGGAGANCPNALQEFNLYTSANQLIFATASSQQNGLTRDVMPCGPHAPTAYLRALTYPSIGCPYRIRLRWIKMTNEAFPYVAIIADLLVASVATNLIIFDPTNYGYSLGSLPLVDASGKWNPNLLYRRAIP